MNLNEKVIELILSRSRFDSVDGGLKMDTDLIKDLGYDSLSLIKLLVEIEETFHFEIEDIEILQSSLSVSTFIDIVKKHQTDS